jgi:hypothetical protein
MLKLRGVLSKRGFLVVAVAADAFLAIAGAGATFLEA